MDGSPVLEGMQVAYSPTDESFTPPTIYEAPLLIGRINADYENLDLCPWAKTMSGYSLEYEEMVYIQQKCNRWGCRHCGARRVTNLAHKTSAAKPNRLLTLTTWTRNYENPRDAFEKCSPLVAQLIRRLRKKHGNIEYLRVVEQHKNGFPHWHLVVRSGYIPFQSVRDEWKALTGNLIVDIRKIKDAKGVYWYIVKYLAKQTHCRFTDRRVSWSRSFFPPQEKRPGRPLNVQELHFEDEHPGKVLKDVAPNGRIIKITRDVMIVNPSQRTLDRLDEES